MLTQPEKPNRSHIEFKEIKYWSKHLKATPDAIRIAIEKVGNSVAAVEKELQNSTTNS